MSGKWKVPAKGAAESNGKAVSWSDADFDRRCPVLRAWLGDVVDAEEEPRETGTLLLFCEQGKVKACLRDRDSNHVAFVSADTLAGLLGACEEALREGDADWREAKQFQPGRRK